MSNELIIPDLHSPFIKKGFLNHCKRVYRKYSCTSVRCTGDIMDNHASSFHTSCPDGSSAIDEFKKTLRVLKVWYKDFPKMKITVGNHDLIPSRKTFEGGVSKIWVKTIEEVMHEHGFKGWQFAEEYYENGILYIHGDGGQAHIRMHDEGCSVVQGHWHSKSKIEFKVTPHNILFSLQLGCGIDRKAYAMAYAKHHKKQQINCGVIIDNRIPIIEPMRM